MAETPIFLNVHIDAVPGREDELAENLTALLAPTRNEPGCLVYKLHRDPKDPTKFMFYEGFAGQAALDAHVAAPHFQKFVAYRGTGVDPVAGQTVTSWVSLEANS